MNVIVLALLALGAADGESGYASEYGHMLHGHCLGPMPQTCYDPPYGCYYGSRWNNRYPAFHGTYYRKAYNYRNYFDYPWHAEMHEPASQRSHHVTGEPGEQPADLTSLGPHEAQQQAPPPLPAPATYQAPLTCEANETQDGSLIDEIRSLLRSGNLVKTPTSSLRTLRR